MRPCASNGAKVGGLLISSPSRVGDLSLARTRSHTRIGYSRRSRESSTKIHTCRANMSGTPIVGMTAAAPKFSATPMLTSSRTWRGGIQIFFAVARHS